MNSPFSVYTLMNFLPVVIMYYYKTKDILYPKFSINYKYSSYFIYQLIFHIIQLCPNPNLQFNYF